MQQRQLRLGDILDDYCPRERRVTNHAVVAMVGPDVKQTRCTTCDAEHEYKHARVPRQRKKAVNPAALYAQVAAGKPKPPALHEPSPVSHEETEAVQIPDSPEPEPAPETFASTNETLQEDQATGQEDGDDTRENERDEGPVHRPLIRASLPRPEGQAPASRPVPEFTIRQPGGRPNRFRPRHQRGGSGGGHMFHGNRSNGNTAGGPPRGMARHGNRPPSNRHGGRKRSK
jgi:hypothetical protein